MIYLAGVILIVYAASLLVLVYSFWQTLRLLRSNKSLQMVRSGGHRRPSLDIVVPVKDEEDNVGQCIESLLAQDYRQARIIVVNDRSSDGTARVVQAIQDRHPEVCRIDIEELPEGHYGKPHALHCIAGKLQSDCVAFVDSDLVLDRACLATLVDHLESNRLDWVAAMGAPKIPGFWERLIVPLFGAVVFAWYDPRKISDPEWDGALGSGLMVCRRNSYESIGGHGAVIDIYDEDSELIRIAKRSGQRVSFVMTPELYTQRHYGTLSNTIHGITRTFAGGVNTIPGLLVTMNALIFVSILPVVLLILLSLAALSNWTVPWAAVWWLAAWLHLLVATGLAWVVYHTARQNPRWALLHPIGSAFLIAICVRAIIQLKRGTPFIWRGTVHARKLPK